MSDVEVVQAVYAAMAARDLPRPIPAIPFRRPSPAIVPYAQPVLADDVVRYVGEPVAVVLADSAELAEDAAQAVELDIGHLPVVADRQMSSRGDVLLIAGTGSNCATTYTANAGDVDKMARHAATSARLIEIAPGPDCGRNGRSRGRPQGESLWSPGRQECLFLQFKAGLPRSRTRSA